MLGDFQGMNPREFITNKIINPINQWADQNQSSPEIRKKLLLLF
jgi:hypothetical protein